MELSLSLASNKQLLESKGGLKHLLESKITSTTSNALPQPIKLSFFTFCIHALNDKTLIILIVAAFFEVGVGIYKIATGGSVASLIDGIAIIIAVFAVVMVSACNDWFKQSKFIKLIQFSRLLSSSSVIRNDQSISIPSAQVKVGDIVVLSVGDIIPADGIFISGFSLKADESTLTGESDALSKSADDPFLFSGSKVVDGSANMIVVATGADTVNGKTLKELDVQSDDTPLQVKLSNLADRIAKIGLAAAFMMIVLLLITYFSVGGATKSSVDLAADIIEIFINGVTVIVVAVPEGLPLAVTLSLSHATIQMLKDNNLVRHLYSCETMGNATVVCTDKTGTLTQNKMSVVKAIVFDKPFDIDSQKPTDSTFFNLLADCINVNSTAKESVVNDKKEFIGSKSEIALLEFTNKLGFPYMESRKKLQVLEMIPFLSATKKMSTIVQNNSSIPGLNSDTMTFVKGASEIILKECNHFVSNGNIVEMNSDMLNTLNANISEYAQQSLRTLSIAVSVNEKFVFLAMFGIADPIRVQVPNAVASCLRAGVGVKMVTGDNVETAKAIATQCGIYTDGIVMEGEEFRKLGNLEMEITVKKLQVLARSSPLDKQILVKCLKRMGETVAVTGDGTNDAAALKAADVGFAMGIAGTEVAKEACDIVLLDDDFSSLVKAVIWGRSVYDSVRKFLQFQLTVNVSAVVITVVSSLISVATTSGHYPDSALSAIQLLWVNLIMDTLAALSLSTDAPTPQLLERNPEKKSDRLINFDMWLQIVGQAIYQIVICFLVLLAPQLFFNGQKFLEEDKNGVTKLSQFATTAVFNVFVLCQLFNEFNSRSITSDINIFRGILKNKTFMSIFIFSFAVQVIIVQLSGIVFHVVPLTWDQWLICVALGFGSIPIGFVIRMIPFYKLLPKHKVDDEAFIQHDVARSLEESSGRHLTDADRIALQSYFERNPPNTTNMAESLAFNEGVKLGAQMALSLKSEDDDQEKSRESIAARERWVTAGARVRRQVGVVDAFRSHRR